MKLSRETRSWTREPRAPVAQSLGAAAQFLPLFLWIIWQVIDYIRFVIYFK